MKAGVIFFFLYLSRNQLLIVISLALKSNDNLFLSSLKNLLNSYGIVQTIWRCLNLNNFEKIDVCLSLLYLLPQEEQSLDLHV